jgi:hypothetical protein
MRLVIGDSFLVVDAAVQRDVDAEGQEPHAAGLTLLAMERLCHVRLSVWTIATPAVTWIAVPIIAAA